MSGFMGKALPFLQRKRTPKKSLSGAIRNRMLSSTRSGRSSTIKTGGRGLYDDEPVVKKKTLLGG